MNKLKAESKAADIWKFVGVLALLLAIITGYLGSTYNYNYAWWLVTILLLVVVSFFKYVRNNDRYTDDFKELIIKEMIEHLCPGAIYKPDICIAEKEYKRSGLFRSYYDDFSGEDYIEGVYKNVPFHCSELKVIYEDTSVIFSGLFFIATINPAIAGGTYAWNRNFEQLPSSIMDAEYRLMPMPNVTRVILPDEAFNKHFSVCSTLPYEALQILSSERMQEIIDFKEQMRGYLAFSFVAGHCYVAIAAAEDILEPGSYEPDDMIELKKYYYTVATVLNVIDQLSLSNLI